MKQLIGLVACGGKSSRMGTDKSMLNYHGLPQAEYLYKMLEPFCSSVYLSVNKEQAILQDCNAIIDHDQYANIGPMAGLLSAFDQYPAAALLLIGCDYPFINREDIQQLVNKRDAGLPATCYFNKQGNVYEPLLGIYEPGFANRLRNNFNQQHYSLQFALQEAGACRAEPLDATRIKSVDTWATYLSVLDQRKPGSQSK